MSGFNETKSILFVYNPMSGGKKNKKDQLPDLIKKYCIGHDCKYTFFETTGNKDSERLKQIVEQSPSYNAVVAIGGDGTVNLAGKTLVGTKIPLGIIPKGSANGLAKDLSLPQDPEEALKLIFRFKSTPIDTLKINGHDSFHISDIGFNARIIHRFSESIVRGKISYMWYGLMEFFTVKPFSYRIETPLLNYEGKSFMMIVTNSNQFGTDVVINPLGKIDDGYFEIIIIKPFSRLMSLHVLNKLLTNTIHRSKYSKLIRCKEATIYNIDRESFHIDGEPHPLSSKIHIKIVPKGLYVLK